MALSVKANQYLKQLEGTGTIIQKIIVHNARSGVVTIKYVIQPGGTNVTPSHFAEMMRTGWLKPHDRGLFDDPQSWTFCRKPVEIPTKRKVTMPNFDIAIVSFRAQGAGTLLGFVEVLVGAVGLVLSGLHVHQLGAKRWVLFPASPRIWDNALVMSVDGKPVYGPPLMYFHDPEIRAAFCGQVLDRLREFDGATFNPPEEQQRISIRDQSCVWREADPVSTAPLKEKEKGMVDALKYFKPVFVALKDVTEGPLQVTIASVAEGAKYGKLVVTFKEGLALSLNATNARVLTQAYGSETDDWVDYTIELYGGEVEFSGNSQPSVLVRAISPKVTEPKLTSKPNNDMGDDEEIPF